MTRRAEEELPVIAATYRLIVDIVPVIDGMPRSRKFSLGDRIEGGLLDVLSLLVAASYISDKSDRLVSANLRLQECRYLIRLAHDLRAIPYKAYERSARSLDDIGRQLGGWLASTRPA